jgi:hypothetical protein
MNAQTPLNPSSAEISAVTDFVCCTVEAATMPWALEADRTSTSKSA